MEKPEMIIFDYGRTLIYQPNYNASNGNKAIYPYIDKNPHNISFEEYDRSNIELFEKSKQKEESILKSMSIIF
ncbi:hypothetical protein C823_001977 [Eubacterium plexicaudatum ASF492]|nr:hypothetical protein C823_001977 [Eubacterium plexicaudatum ASF492]